MKKVVIVGGGSAGWMAAAYLNGALNRGGKQKTVDITLIESPTTPRISVGEATIPSIGHVLSVIGIDEMDFMKATDATFKQSIKYANWLENNGTYYHHPFSRVRPGPIDYSGPEWMRSQRDIAFSECVCAQTMICEWNMAPKMLGEWTFGAPMKYAYHMNAAKFADYLRDFSVARGVHHILANVVDVSVKDPNIITSVKLDIEQDVEGDIFIDSTGFSALLIGKTLNVPHDDYSQWLLCNQAIVAQFPYEDYFPGIVRPYTTATALSAGWVWDIPMQNRRSLGYVHSSDFIDEASARKELLAYQGLNEDADEIETRIIKFRVGQRRQAWVGNCIAIGLAGGFIEPLESTGLYLADLSAVMLAEHFPYDSENMAALAFRYNRILSNRYLEILDFINMHYCLTRRTDSPFWKAVQQPEHINDRLKSKLEFWHIKAPSNADFEDQAFAGYPYEAKPFDPTIDNRPPVDTAGLWNHESYECILYGMDFRGPEFKEKFGDKRPPSRVFPFIIDRLREAPRKLPPHHIWLNKTMGMPQYEKKMVPAGWV